ncbi:Transglutaminase-like superfamily protein [Ruminococcaceae bacterium FB2012]|nr:Transglutaminase-like superfamily protein [Ruminococcaceae bacterium FB2012]
MIGSLISKAKKPIAFLLSLALAAGALSSAELSGAIFSDNAVTVAEAATVKTFDGAVDTALYIREQLKTDTSTITFNVRKTFGYDSDKIFAFGDLVFDHLAKGYTGKADEGDIFFPRQYTNLTYDYSTANDYITMTFTVAKNVTASQQKDVNEAVAKIKKDLKLTSLASDYDRILAVHDWLVKNVKYDDSLKKHSVYDAIVGKKSVCEGYALATYLMLNDLGIPCRMMTGTGNGDNHAWNIVYLEGKWYYLDTTWDANAYEQGVPEKSHEFFLKCWKNFPNHTKGKQTITDWDDIPYNYASSDFTGTKGSSAGYAYPVMTATGFKTDISKAKISLSYASYGYDGNAKRPSVTVKLNGTKLTKDKDYRVTYKNNVRKGTAYAVVTGKGKYAGTAQRSYHIGEQMTSISIPYSSYTYTGSKIAPKVTVKNASGKVLTAGVDYTVSYSSNINLGLAKITVVGKGTYGGTKTKTFVIKPKKNKIVSLTNYQHGFKVVWTSGASPAGATGYQVLYSKDPKFKNGVHSYTSTNLSDVTENFTSVPRARQIWYVKVRTFITKDGDPSSTRYGNYSEVMKIRTR